MQCTLARPARVFYLMAELARPALCIGGDMELEGFSKDLANGLLVAGLTLLGLVAVYLVEKRVLGWVKSVENIRSARRQQLATLVRIVRWILGIALVASAVLMLLSTFGLDITPFLASVGVAGLAVSLGAQSLIKDLIGGLLVIIENQYAVDDFIEVGSVSGWVERITLRATLVRALNGDLCIVPNGEVRILVNRTRDWSRVLVDLGVAYDEDLDRALRILEESAEAFAEDPALAPHLLEPPAVLGVASLGDSAAQIRLAIKTQPGKQWEVGRQLRKFLLAACEREGISLPYPRQEVWLHPHGEGGAPVASE
jgi:small conductance mechanosensitive channel